MLFPPIAVSLTISPLHITSIIFLSRHVFHLHKLAKRSAPAERIGRSTSIVVSSVIIAFHNHNTSPFLLEATTSAVYLVYYCVLCCVLLRHVCIFSVEPTLPSARYFRRCLRCVAWEKRTSKRASSVKVIRDTSSRVPSVSLERIGRAIERLGQHRNTRDSFRGRVEPRGRLFQ